MISTASVPQPPATQLEDGRESYALTVQWPWWARPVWPILLLTGVMAFISIRLSDASYHVWESPKFLVGEYVFGLTTGIAALFLGLGVTRALNFKNGSTTLSLSARQVAYLRGAYRALFFLTMCGYALWVGAAISQGVGFGDLTAVLAREAGAISDLKSNSRPIGGLTTLTQFGPVAVALGVLLRKLGSGNRTYWWILALSLLRVFFYAERLALIELLVPYLLMSVLLVQQGKRTRRIISLAPVFFVPLVWAVFAISEYTRSWVYYQDIVDMSFMRWVTLRLLGYYTTSFNHSALFAEVYGSSNAPPYFSIPALWDAPVVGSVLEHPGINGIGVTDWWAYALYLNSNPEFNNPGSFLVTYAEFGWLMSGLIWLAVGVFVGLTFSRMSKGSVPALMAYPCLFVGILELPRFIYWSQGRATPALLALLIIALTYPRQSEVASRSVAKT